MNIIVDISVENPGWAEEDIVKLATFALEQEEAPEGCEVSVSLVSVEEITELNQQYRGKEGPTDVLSFPCDDPWDEELENEDEIAIGDIMICTDVVREQAPTYGHTFEEEMSLMLVHGCLHLLGYDHMVEEEAEEMEARERDILGKWGIER